MTDTCANCSFFRASTCRIDPPVISTIHHESTFHWPRVKDTDWCAAWNCWPGRQPTVSGAHATVGQTLPDPADGSDGDFYVYHTIVIIGPDRYIDHGDLYQKQSGNWIVIASLV